jgi:hypothetical protein
MNLTCERCGRGFVWTYPYEGTPAPESIPKKCKRSSCKGKQKAWEKRRVRTRAIEADRADRELGTVMREVPRGELYPF